MAHGFSNVSKSQPCPICGKEDWCGWMPVDHINKMIVCMREKENCNRQGYDGKFYVFHAISKEGNLMFEEASQRFARLEEFKRQNGFSSKKKNYKQVKYQPPKEQKKLKVDEIKPKSNKELDKIYRELLSMLVLDKMHAEYLKREKWDTELIETWHIRSFPERDFLRFKYKNSFSKNNYRKILAARLIEKFGPDSLRGVPGAFKDAQGNWTFAGPKGILFPVTDVNGYIYRLRIRMDFTDVSHELHRENGKDLWYEENNIIHYVVPMKGTYIIKDGKKVWEKPLGKYRNFSSFHEDEEELKNGIIKNSYNLGCEAGNNLGIYLNSQRDNMYLCYVTEGEKKGIFCNDKLRKPFISLPGVNSWAKLIQGVKGTRSIDILKEKGVRIFIIAFDADKNTNSAVLKNEKYTIEALKNEGFEIGVAYWDSNYGKGIDDLLASGHKPFFEPV